MNSHEIDYKIYGDDLQVVEVELDKDETIIAEAGTMNWMDDGISFEAKLGDGSNPAEGMMDKVFNVGKRHFTGESIFLTHFTSNSSGKRRIAFSAPYPGKIVPLDLSKYVGEITCQKDAFLCAAMGTKIDITFTKKIGAGLFGNEGFILQHLKGDGQAFLHAGGMIVKKELNNETISVDTGCIVAFTKDIDYDIKPAGNLKSMLFAGEGLFLAKLSGKGTVYLQSMPFSRLANRILRNAPMRGGKKRGEGSIIGGFSSVING